MSDTQYLLNALFGDVEDTLLIDTAVEDIDRLLEDTDNLIVIGDYDDLITDIVMVQLVQLRNHLHGLWREFSTLRKTIDSWELE